jgi:hypothetical protein
MVARLGRLLAENTSSLGRKWVWLVYLGDLARG